MTMDDEDRETLATVGPRLRAVREQRQATLAQLSQASGVSVHTLSRLESGGRKPTLELLLRLARAASPSGQLARSAGLASHGACDDVALDLRGPPPMVACMPSRK
jgi:transcriptional regulator with XRE-family HTH domain